MSLGDITLPFVHPEGEARLDGPTCHWVGTAPLCEADASMDGVGLNGRKGRRQVLHLGWEGLLLRMLSGGCHGGPGPLVVHVPYVWRVSLSCHPLFMFVLDFQLPLSTSAFLIDIASADIVLSSLAR